MTTAQMVRANGRGRRIENGGVTLIEAPTLDALGNSASHEIDLAQKAATNALQHALAAGDLLVEAKGRLRGKWLAWLEEHGINRQTAGVYMRVATYRDALAGKGVTNVGQALTYLREQGLVLRVEYGPDLTYEIKRLRTQGVSKRETAKRLGVSEMTVQRRIHGDVRLTGHESGGGRPRNPDGRNGITRRMIEGMAIWLSGGDPAAVDDLVRLRAQDALRAAYAYTGVTYSDAAIVSAATVTVVTAE